MSGIKTSQHIRFSIIPYSHDLKNDWDFFVESSKNGTFLLKRDYIDYHSDRFSDNSLIITRNDAFYSILPACRIKNNIYSHAGLTYGGMLMNRKCTSAEILDVFTLLRENLKSTGIEKLVYKPIPYIYHSLPSEEDLYALFRLDAKLVARNISSVVFNDNRIKFRSIRNSGIKKAIHADVKVRRSDDFDTFWTILASNLLLKYNAHPVHTFKEIENLRNKFPNEIKLFGAFIGDTMEGGVLIYETRHVAHCQYISATPYGKAIGAIDIIFDVLLNKTFKDKRFFDFGTSNENGGKILNEQLIYQKEGFGGRAICYDTYCIPIN